MTVAEFSVRQNGGALLDERAHAFLAIVGIEKDRRGVQLERHRRLRVGLQALVYSLLGEAHRQSWLARDQRRGVKAL